MRKIFSTLTAIATVAFIVDGAQAAMRFAVASGNWNAGIWAATSNGVPGSAATPTAADRVDLNGFDVTVNISSAVADTLNVPSSSTLTISAGNVLTLDNSDNNLGAGAPEHSIVDGDIQLAGAASELAFSSNSHNITNSGGAIPKLIQGSSSTAVIRIATASIVVTLAGGYVEGGLEIRAQSSTFTNNGSVHANAALTLALYSGTFNGSGDYQVSTNGSAVMNFRPGISFSSSHAQPFTIATGTLDLDESVCVTGDLQFLGGSILVASGKSFKAGGSCP